MLLKLKRIKRQISKHTFGHSVRNRERERERERERVKNLEELREGRTAGAGAEEVTSQRQIFDDQSTVWRLQISDRAPEQRPISDLR